MQVIALLFEISIVIRNFKKDYDKFSAGNFQTHNPSSDAV